MENKELDAWIAEHVMGWKFIDRRAAGYGDGPVVYETGDPNNPTYQGFYPSADSDAAMQVLEKCIQKRTESWDVHRPDATLVIHGPHKEWDNNWVIGSDAELTITAQAKTLPLAICLFAKLIFSKDAKTQGQPE